MLKKLKQLNEAHALEKRIKELEASIKDRNRLIERLESENASLQERVKDLVFEYRDVGGQIASLNFRIFKLTEENKILTMNLTGARAQRDGMQKWIEKIKEKYGRENV
jgi:predicted nuclease with TOPRIM domain